MEEWRSIKDYPKYEVSDHGQIRNITNGYHYEEIN